MVVKTKNATLRIPVQKSNDVFMCFFKMILKIQINSNDSSLNFDNWVNINFKFAMHGAILLHETNNYEDYI